MTPMSPPSIWTLEDIIALFDGIFASGFNTRLIRGDDEPLYLPADQTTDYHRVIFARGYYASALHEISHWCIAGAERRQREDYGYWYLPDGRDPQQQAAFEQAETAPQAIERLFCEASGRSFHVSVDNLAADMEVDRDAFTRKVAQQADQYRVAGLPVRAAAFYDALHHYYQDGGSIEAACRQGKARLGRLA